MTGSPGKATGNLMLLYECQIPISQGSITSLSSVILGLDPGIHECSCFSLWMPHRVRHDFVGGWMPHQVRHDFGGGGCCITCDMTLWELSTFIGLTLHLPRCHPRASRARPGDPSQYHFSPLPITYYPVPFCPLTFFILGLDQGGGLKNKKRPGLPGVFCCVCADFYQPYSR